MSGIALIFAFVIAVVVMILAISELKIYQFLSTMTVLLLLGNELRTYDVGSGLQDSGCGYALHSVTVYLGGFPA